ncbi:protein MFI isoform X2 [Alosa pseudoharengus]|uniref:protein MFI isoform X2 n=1 Tax=Alosa pseudoharengus TaxID=34774 RepID=UPI003F891A9F
MCFLLFVQAFATMRKKKLKYAESAPKSSPVEDIPSGENSTLDPPEYEIQRDKAIRVIQRSWKRHVDIQVFKYYRELINFHNQGHPHILLKHVNPREADILDPGAGVFIRFRLGGITFPPNIYYKIFTHRPVVDLCASSPKDYTHEAQRQLVPRQRHNHHPVVHDDRSSWYKRVENNGWRVLAGKIIQLYCPKMNELDCACRYEEGILRARTGHKETALLVEKSTYGMMCVVKQLGADHVAEWEVDELLEWTNALNFDEYINGWKTIGSSQSSEYVKDERLLLSRHNPCEASQLTQEDSQFVTNSSGLHPQISNIIKSDHSSDCVRMPYGNSSSGRYCINN